jgi:hypothetical protein
MPLKGEEENRNKDKEMMKVYEIVKKRLRPELFPHRDKHHSKAATGVDKQLVWGEGAGYRSAWGDT